MSTHPITSRKKTERATRLGELIRLKREERGLGSAEFAKLTRISRSHLWYIEDGTIEHIRLDKFCQVAEALRFPADELLREAGYLPSAPKSKLPEAEDYLRERYKLSPEGIRQALDFLDFLAKRERRLLMESQ